MFRMIRYYSIVSLGVIIVAAAVMVTAYRTVAIRGIVSLAESNNLVLARTAVNPIKSALADYLTAINAEGADAHEVPLPPQLDQAVSELMRDSRVVRINIFDRHGVIAYSTQHDLIGTSEVGNRGIASALGGSMLATIIYRDAFNLMDRPTDEDNLIQSYIPVRRRPTEPVLGIFELYSSVDSLVNEAERTEILIALVTFLILGGMYAVLLTVVRRATAIIDDQQQTIRQKNVLLEQLSRRSQHREELERKQFAADLHEGLAQTLSAVKLAVETARDAGPKSPAGNDPLKAIIPGLQAAIRQVRTIAMGLRPPSLDEFGLLPTIHMLCREFSELYPGTRIAEQITAPEAGIPAPLKMIVYRNIETALKAIGEAGLASDVRVALQLHDHDLTLVVEDNGTAVVPAPDSAGESGDVESPHSTIRDRSVLSGGEVSMVPNAEGGTTLRVSWGI